MHASIAHFILTHGLQNQRPEKGDNLMVLNQTISDAQQAAPQLLNINAYAGATIPGDYSTTVPNSVAFFNQIMMKQAEHFDPFIQQSLIDQPRFWYNMIPRGAFPNFSGYKKETRIYRGGQVHYAGLQDWGVIDPEPSESNNPCAKGAYTTKPYAWERLEWFGYERWWGSDPVCLKQLQYVDKATQQLAWILQSGADYGISLQEVWNRDYLLYISNQESSRSYVMTTVGAGTSTPPRYYYDPFVTAAQVTDAEAKAGLADSPDKPFVVFAADVEPEPLNFDILDNLHESLDVRCPKAAIGHDGGMNIYGLPVSHRDFLAHIKGNQYERENWREAHAEKLITGMDLGVKTHHNYSMMFDENQFRMKLLKYVTTYDSTEFGGVGAALDGEAVWIAQYVPPRVNGRLGENGAYIVEDNPEYISAELALTPIMLSKVFTNMMGTPLNSLGSGTYFGPQSGMNGTWSWVNEYDATNNPERLVGNFRGKFEIFPEPNKYTPHATSYLYRRCTEPIRTRCPVDVTDVNPDAAASPKNVTSYAVTSIDATLDSAIVVLAMPNTVIGAGIGASLTLAVAGAGPLDGTNLVAYIMKAAGTSYTVQINGITGLVTPAPTTGVAGYYVEDGLLHYTDAEDTVTEMTFGAFTLT